jgi:hypothetical protein
LVYSFWHSFCSFFVVTFCCQPLTWHVCVGFMSQIPSIWGVIHVVIACWWPRSGFSASWMLSMVVDCRLQWWWRLLKVMVMVGKVSTGHVMLGMMDLVVCRLCSWEI